MLSIQEQVMILVLNRIDSGCCIFASPCKSVLAQWKEVVNQIRPQAIGEYSTGVVANLS
jgi:hypothetical protein